MTIRDLLENSVSKFHDSVFQKFHDGDRWVERTYKDAMCRVELFAGMLKRLGLEPGRNSAAIMLDNQPDWQILYLALSACGITAVPIDPKLRAAEASHILGDSGCSCLFAGVKQHSILEESAASLPNLKTVVWNDAHAPFLKGVETHSLQDLLSDPTVTSDGKSFLAAHKPSESDIASLIYTSGTTGKPKGAMLTHSNFCSNLEQTLKRVSFYQTDNFLNILPLFHAFSFMGNFLLPLATGAQISFARNLKTIADDMIQLKPSILFAVPLLAEKLYQRINSQLKKSLIATGMFKFKFSRKIIAKMIVERFGGKLRLLGIGGAPTSIETLEGFMKIGIFVLEGYGITECSPGVAYPNPSDFKPGTVGPVLPGMDYKIVNQDETGAGELLVRGPNVMKGYWHNEEQTLAAFDSDGFYKTGDIVRQDSKGNISICGRTKALIVNREGKNIYPEELEQALEHAPLIKDAIVLGYKTAGETGEHVGCIIVPDEDAVKAHFKGKVLTREEIRSFITEYAQGVCKASVADYKIPRKYSVRFDPLERTPSLKIRRVVYARALDES